MKQTKTYTVLKPGQPLFNLDEQDPKNFQELYERIARIVEKMPRRKKAKYLVSIENAITESMVESKGIAK